MCAYVGVSSSVRWGAQVSHCEKKTLKEAVSNSWRCVMFHWLTALL